MLTPEELEEHKRTLARMGLVYTEPFGPTDMSDAKVQERMHNVVEVTTRSPSIFDKQNDFDLGNQVRMLTRQSSGHEIVVEAARNRIFKLGLANAELVGALQKIAAGDPAAVELAFAALIAAGATTLPGETDGPRLFIRRILDISTANLPHSILDALWSGDGPASLAIEHGDDPAFVLLNVPPADDDDDPLDDWPSSLAAIARVARKNGCDFLKIDRDGEKIDVAAIEGETARD